jgi:hypothetical protein
LYYFWEERSIVGIVRLRTKATEFLGLSIKAVVKFVRCNIRVSHGRRERNFLLVMVLREKGRREEMHGTSRVFQKAKSICRHVQRSSPPQFHTTEYL